MISPHQFDAIGKTLPLAPPDPAVSTAGDIVLVTGHTLTGYWRFWITLELADFVASDGKRWVIPLSSIVAFAPTPVA